MRLFENSSSQQPGQPGDSCLLNTPGGASTPLASSPNILPQPAHSPTMLPTSSSITTPSPMIDLDSGAITIPSSQPLLRSNTPSPGGGIAMSPADTILIPSTLPTTTATANNKDNQTLIPSKSDTLHTNNNNMNKEDFDNGRTSPLTIKPRKNSGPSVFGGGHSVTATTPTDQLTSSNRLVPGRQLLTPTSTPPTTSTHQLGHASKLSPRMMSTSSPDTGLLHSSKPMVRARSHSDQQTARDTSSLSTTITTHGLLKAEPYQHHQQQQYPQKSNKHYHHRPAPSVPIAHMSSTTTIMGEERGLKPNMAGLPLARRVRSATTLRRSEEDSVPLKALVTNKQQQLYQASRHNNLSQMSDGGDNNNQGKTKGKASKYTTDHRRSISADSTPKVRII